MSELPKKEKKDQSLTEEYHNRIKPHLEKARWMLRITEHKDKPLPVFIIKERLNVSGGQEKTGNGNKAIIIKDRGLIYGQSMRRCLPIIQHIVSRVCDTADIPFELQRYLPRGRIFFRGNLPLDEEAGAKLSLIFKLQERVLDMDRVELLAWRIERFSREEALYWLTRATQYGLTASRWAQAGMRIMLGGQPGDKAIPKTLEKMRR